MALWGNQDANTSAPKWTVGSGVGYTGTGDDLYNDTPVGIFAVAANEKQGTGNVESLLITTAGSGFTARPTVTVTGANTVQAVATANGTVVGVAITAVGTGYAVDEYLTVTAGTGTSGNLIVTAVDANGNISAVGINLGGDYTVLPTLTNNPFTSNTSVAGVGFRANLSIGIGSTQVTTIGEGYGSDVAVTVGGAGGVDAVVDVQLTGQEGTTKSALAGWNLRTEGTGGRAGRVHYECLVAMGSIEGDGADDTQLAE